MRSWIDGGCAEEARWGRLGIPAQGDALLTLIRAGFPFCTLERVGQVFQLTPKQLRERLAISASTLRRRRQSGRLTPSESDQLFQLAVVLTRVYALFEDDVAQAQEWMGKPVYGLGGRCANDMLGTEVERHALLTLVGQIEHGVLS
ncbi:antitoxin Xre-like helix-turn-helix domain-containing protein [Pseudomonas guariconensis]|uniref:antitoxin Xre-like helix-turn-helix domain-containing protein n=1 Tax=Pseudomonas guariconensis TaxID=1288410 RepID=UPI002B05F50C|nr:antitoxin Xre-like helix-turn-helix domain-containing protein [Pseudomonas guariconensis]